MALPVNWRVFEKAISQRAGLQASPLLRITNFLLFPSVMKTTHVHTVKFRALKRTENASISRIFYPFYPISTFNIDSASPSPGMRQNRKYNNNSHQYCP